MRKAIGDLLIGFGLLGIVWGFFFTLGAAPGFFREASLAASFGSIIVGALMAGLWIKKGAK